MGRESNKRRRSASAAGQLGPSDAVLDDLISAELAEGEMTPLAVAMILMQGAGVGSVANFRV